MVASSHYSAIKEFKALTGMNGEVRRIGIPTQGLFIMEKEIWKDIKGYEGLYQVSNHGKVRSLDRLWPMKGDGVRIRQGIIKKNRISSNGYERIGLWKNSKATHFSIHRLVAQAFIPNTDNKPVINHKDGIKTNNYYLNLEWCTQKENSRHALDTGLSRPNKGQKHWRSKISNNKAKKIKKCLKTAYLHLI